MLMRTHLAVGLSVALYFLPHINNKVIFIPLVLAATMLPNIDLGFSNEAGKRGIFRLRRGDDSPRSLIHSYTLCISLSVFLAFFYPLIAFPFFLGYSFHLFLDSFTVRGIKPFWPWKKTSKGSIRNGGKVERAIFVVVVILNIALFVKLFV